MGAKSLPDELSVWIADNLMRGVARERIIEQLALRRIDSREAVELLRSVETHPLFALGKAFATQARQAASVARLRREQARAAKQPIPRVRSIATDTLLASHYAANWPVLITEFAKDWPALGWTLEELRKRFGNAEVEITRDREGDPNFDRNHDKHCERMRFDAYIDMVKNAGETNDFYLVARNRAFAGTLGALLDDIRFDDRLIDRARLPNEAALWFGPKGTVTPLHHDTSNILLCQVLGRKRVTLASPDELSLFDSAKGLYAGIDAENDKEVEALAIRRYVIDLSPGEAIFIPAGWWHHVRALDVSISVAINSFRAPNRFDWYQPGAL